jgi:hypothetical protein
MASSGIRVGAFEYLKLKHITPIYKDNDEKKKEIIAAKLVVYAGEPEEYITFMTPEAYQALQEYIAFRELHKEVITGESWVMRDKFPTTSEWHAANKSMATNPQKLDAEAIKKLLQRALKVQGLRKPLSEGEHRHEFKTTHAFRKFFKTNAERAMKTLNVEVLMGHDNGIHDNYYDQYEEVLQEEYLKAVEFLTINTNQKVGVQVQKQFTALTEKYEQENYAILGRLTEKEKEAETMKKRLEEIEKNQEQVIRTAKSLSRLESYLEMHNDKKIPETLETLLSDYLEPDPDPDMGSPFTPEEYAKRNRELPELAAALRKLRMERLQKPCQKCGQPMKNGLPVIKEQNDKNNNNNNNDNDFSFESLVGTVMNKFQLCGKCSEEKVLECFNNGRRNGGGNAKGYAELMKLYEEASVVDKL